MKVLLGLGLLAGCRAPPADTGEPGSPAPAPTSVTHALDPPLVLDSAEDSAADTAVEAPDPTVEQIDAYDDGNSDTLFDDDALESYAIELSWQAVEALRSDPYTYVEGAFRFEGRTYSPVGVRLKGQNSFEPIDEKPSIKVKFNEYVDGARFHGLQELTFDNMDNDGSMMHERLAYLMYREAGLPASRCTHALLNINGENYGLYAFVETVDSTFLERWYASPEGSLFEIWDVDFTDDSIDLFTLKEGPDDRTRLQGLADALEEPDETAMDSAAAWLDIDGFLLYWAVGAVVGQFDAYPYSAPGDDAYVYDDPETGVLHFLPHGVDETFYYPTYNVESVNGTVAAHCLLDADCQAALREKIWEVQAVSEAIDLVSSFDEVQAQIAAYVEEDPRRPYSLDEVLSSQDQMRSFIADRPAALEEMIGARP